MGFAIPDLQPEPPANYLPPNIILAETMASVVVNDRFTFATRRRLLASTTYFETLTTVTRCWQFQAKTLPTSSGNIVIAAVGKSVEIEVSAVNAGVSTTLTFGLAFSGQVGYLAGIAADAFEEFRIKVTPNNLPTTAIVYGVSIFEQRLDEAELPTY